MKKWPVVLEISSRYIYFKKKLQYNKYLLESIKNSFVIWLFVFSVWFYWYFVNISSTKWYFLRENMNILEEIRFENNIERLTISKLEKDILDELLVNNFDPNFNKVELDKVIVINDVSELAMLKDEKQ